MSDDNDDCANDNIGGEVLNLHNDFTFLSLIRDLR